MHNFQLSEFLNQILFAPGKCGKIIHDIFWEAFSFNMDENRLSSLPLGGKNQQLSAWICTTCHAGVAWVLTAECTGHTVGGRNPAPVDMVNIPLFTRFLDP